MKQLNIRKIQSEEDIRRAKACVPEGCAEPKTWDGALMVERGGEIAGIGGIQFLARFEPCYFKQHDPVAMLMLMGEIDGMFRQMGVKQYEFFIQDGNPKFQTFVEQYLPVTSGREKPGKTYFRKLE